MTMAAARSDRVSANVTSRIAARPPTSTVESQPRESATAIPYASRPADAAMPWPPPRKLRKTGKRCPTMLAMPARYAGPSDTPSR